MVPDVCIIWKEGEAMAIDARGFTQSDSTSPHNLVGLALRLKCLVGCQLKLVYFSESNLINVVPHPSFLACIPVKGF